MRRGLADMAADFPGRNGRQSEAPASPVRRRSRDRHCHGGSNFARLIIHALLITMFLEVLAVWSVSLSTSILDSVSYSISFGLIVISIEIICTVTFLIPGFPVLEASWLAATICLGVLMQIVLPPHMAGYTVALLGVNVTAFKIVFPIVLAPVSPVLAPLQARNRAVGTEPQRRDCGLLPVAAQDGRVKNA